MAVSILITSTCQPLIVNRTKGPVRLVGRSIWRLLQGASLLVDDFRVDAIEAMSGVEEGPRELWVSSEKVLEKISHGGA